MIAKEEVPAGPYTGVNLFLCGQFAMWCPVRPHWMHVLLGGAPAYCCSGICTCLKGHTDPFLQLVA